MRVSSGTGRTRSRSIRRTPRRRWPIGSCGSGSGTWRGRSTSPQPLPPADTIAGAFLRDLEARIAEAEQAGSAASAAELREALRLGRRAMAASPVPMRISRLQLRDVKRYRDLQIDLAPGLTIIRGPNEAGKSTISGGRSSSA